MAAAMAFVADHQLALRWAGHERSPVSLVVDLELGVVTRAAPPLEEGVGRLLTTHRAGALHAVPRGGSIELRNPSTGKTVKALTRAGRFPLVRWLDEATLFSSRGEVLNRWNVATSKPHKFKCHDDVTHVATTPALLAAHNKEGVVSFFDARKPTRLVCLRPTFEGWIAFDDAGAWDASPGFARGVELSWSDAKSTAFAPDVGFGWLELNQPPLTRIVASSQGRTPGLLALRTAGRW